MRTNVVKVASSDVYPRIKPGFFYLCAIIKDGLNLRVKVQTHLDVIVLNFFFVLHAILSTFYQFSTIDIPDKWTRLVTMSKFYSLTTLSSHFVLSLAGGT